MSSFKEWVEKRLEQERVNLLSACDSNNEKEEANAWTAKWTLVDVERELKSVQLELLYNLQANMDTMNKYANESSTREHFYKIDLGLMSAYRRLFGTGEYDKLMTGEGIQKELDLDKIKSVIKEVKE